MPCVNPQASTRDVPGMGGVEGAGGLRGLEGMGGMGGVEGVGYANQNLRTSC